VNEIPDESWPERRRRQQNEARERQAAQSVESARQLGALTDAELMATAPGFPGPRHEMEMQRRLKDAVEMLTDEIVTSRESSERQSGQLDDSLSRLAAEVITSRESSDRLAKRVVFATYVLVALTLVLVALTIVLAAKS